MKNYRHEYDLPDCIIKFGWQYHHLGIPVTHEMPGERHIPHLKLYVKGFDNSPFGVEWMRFEDDCPVHELIKTVPHLAFVVPDLEKAIQENDFEILSDISSPMDGVKVAMIKHDEAPIELMEFNE